MVVILLCGDHSVNSSVCSPEPTQRYLYQGARWGPFNVSIPLTEEDTGLSLGQTANASLTLRLITDVSYDSPGYRLSGYAPVFGDGAIFVQIHDPGSQQYSNTPAGSIGQNFPLLPSLLVGGGLLLLAARIILFRTRPNERHERH